MEKKFPLLYAIRGGAQGSGQVQFRSETLLLVGDSGRFGFPAIRHRDVVPDLVSLVSAVPGILDARRRLHRLRGWRHLSRLHVNGRHARHTARNDARDSNQGLGAMASSPMVPRGEREARITKDMIAKYSWEDRIERARQLASSLAYAKEILRFYAEILQWQQDVF